MRAKVGNLSFELPEAFAWSETSVAYRAAPPAEVRDPRLLQKQGPVARPNLVVNQRSTAEMRTLEEVVDDLTKRLAATVTDIQDLDAKPVTFADGKDGVLVSFLFPYRGSSMLRQMHAVRLDGGTVTTLVLTTGGALSDAEDAKYRRELMSARVEELS